LLPGSAYISYIFWKPPDYTNVLFASTFEGKTFANWAQTYVNILFGANYRSGSKAGRWVHIWMMFFNDFLDLSFKSFELSGSMYTARSLEGTSASAKNLAWSGECLPI